MNEGSMEVGRELKEIITVIFSPRQFNLIGLP